MARAHPLFDLIRLSTETNIELDVRTWTDRVRHQIVWELHPRANHSCDRVQVVANLLDLSCQLLLHVDVRWQNLLAAREAILSFRSDLTEEKRVLDAVKRLDFILREL
jgi:hypothetical protein